MFDMSSFWGHVSKKETDEKEMNNNHFGVIYV